MHYECAFTTAAGGGLADWYQGWHQREGSLPRQLHTSHLRWSGCHSGHIHLMGAEDFQEPLNINYCFSLLVFHYYFLNILLLLKLFQLISFCFISIVLFFLFFFLFLFFSSLLLLLTFSGVFMFHQQHRKVCPNIQTLIRVASNCYSH